MVLAGKQKKPQDCAVDLRGYITSNAHFIDYESYIEKDYFTGSGAIESGNKSGLLVQCVEKPILELLQK